MTIKQSGMRYKKPKKEKSANIGCIVAVFVFMAFLGFFGITDIPFIGEWMWLMALGIMYLAFNNFN